MLEDNTLSAPQEEYLEWLTTAKQERDILTKQDFARHLGVNVKTLRRWEARDVFRKRWEERSKEVVGSPERTQDLLDTLFQRGMGGDVAAAKLYFTVTGAIKPPEITVKSDSSASSYSDAELEAMIAAAAAVERDMRAGERI